LKYDARERFGKNVGGVLDSRSVGYDEGLGFNMRTDEVVANVDMLGFSVVGIID